jgi:hypothetical protein
MGCELRPSDTLLCLVICSRISRRVVQIQNKSHVPWFFFEPSAIKFERTFSTRSFSKQHKSAAITLKPGRTGFQPDLRI